MPTSAALYIGLISGTSIDGIDAALVDLQESSKPRLIATHTQTLRKPLQAVLRQLATGECHGLNLLGEVDAEFGNVLAEAALAVAAAGECDMAEVLAIGSHGQTVLHSVNSSPAFTLQIGDPNRIAQRCGRPVVADFRRRDMALGGQGAPLAPAFHAATLSTDSSRRAVVNLGGIANVTLLLPGSEVIGYDTGPANTLLDVMARRHLHQSCDHDGAWAAKGQVDTELLTKLLADPYFQQAAPKSTGPEYFSEAWLDTHGIGADSDAATARDQQATLTALSAESVAAALRGQDIEEVLICGGGVHNGELMRQLQAAMGETPVRSTAAYGIEPDWVEAMAFAWLAQRHLAGETGNLPSVTGASAAAVLGSLTPA